MWNSWGDILIIDDIKKLTAASKHWFYLRKLKKASDRDRMENEELITILTYLEFQYEKEGKVVELDIYQKLDRLNSRIKNKAGVTVFLQKITEGENEQKENFKSALKTTKAFMNNVKTILLNKNCTSRDELEQYLDKSLNELFRAGREKGTRRTFQDFYFLWFIIKAINSAMIKEYRLEIRDDIHDIFVFLKTIPQKLQENSKGAKEFFEKVLKFQEKYSISERKIRLTQEQKRNLILSQGGTSPISGNPIFEGDDLEVDHIEPIALGGSDREDNLQIVHKSENRKKSTKT